MMASFMRYFGGRKDAKQATRDAIVTLRQQLQMQDKKEKYLEEKIAKDLKIAKENAVANKNGSFCDPLVEVFNGTERCTRFQPPLQLYDGKRRPNRSWSDYWARGCNWRCR